MAIIIHTNQPNLLLDKIYDAIDAKKADKWERTTDGRLTYGALLWKNEAFSNLKFGSMNRNCGSVC